MLLGQFQDGALRVVAPAEAATADEIIYSKPDWQ